ncbi:MAG: ferritin-like domain-containing protein [Myxococcales bacterium]|nr:ferritin-like domain-containing protein [Myxococcales bacterium]
MTPEAFVATLEEGNRALLDALAGKSAAGETPGAMGVAQLLKVALKNELEATELAALWLCDTPEIDARLALARQCGDEAKHYRWIEERLAALGVDLTGFDPSASGPSPLLTHLRSLRTTVERAAAGQFTREAIAVARNEVFAAFCDERGDAETAALYRERIQPDEQHHHQLGRRLLLKYALTDEAQQAARAAARTTLRIADEVQELARLKAGMCRLPGC